MNAHGTWLGKVGRRCLGALAMVTGILLQGAVWHVRSDGLQEGDGKTWERALGSLERALELAEKGDSIWVGAGVYEPTALREFDGEAAFGASFWLKDGVSVYGGFRGDERTPGERRLKPDGIYGWEFESVTVLRQREGQLGSVLRAPEAGLSYGCELNGLVLEGGRALGTYEEGLGGGLYGKGKLTVVNCLCQKNLARNGGGIHWTGELVMMCTGLYDNDLVSEGWSGLGGGAMIEGDGYLLTGIVCAGNGMASGGVQSGGGLYLSGKGMAAHCTLVGNRTRRNGSGAWLANGATLENSLVWGNVGRLSQVILDGGRTVTCGIEGWSLEDSGDIPLLPENCGPGGIDVNDNWIDGYYPCFVSVSERDFRLGEGSYGLNRGGDGSIDGLDALGVPLAESFPADLGACGSKLKGNLAMDFSVEHPHLYGGESQLQVYYGMASPAGIDVGFWGTEGAVAVEEVADGQWLATWLAAKEVEVVLRADVRGVEATYWHPFDLSKALAIKPRPLLVAATDLEYRHGSGEPVLEWSIAAGRLVFEDQLAGRLHCDHEGQLGKRVPITRGTLTVDDGREGKNYQLAFLDGEMIYAKGLAEVTVAGNKAPYDGAPLDLTVTTEPPGLEMTIAYQGRDGTEYGPSDAPPQNAGSYLAKITIQNDEYEGVSDVPLTITKANLTATAEDKQRRFGEENPILTIRYEGFVGGDNETDLEPPVAHTEATKDSPVRAEGYEIAVTGGQSGNYHILPVSGRLMIGRGRPAVGEVRGEDIDYGQAVASSSLSSSGSRVPGRFRWCHPETVPGAGESVQQWVFTPEDESNWETLEGTASLQVRKRKVVVELGTYEQIYGDPSPEFEVRIVSGSLVEGDRFQGRPDCGGASHVGEHVISAGSLSLGANYELTVRSGLLRIAPRPVTLQAVNLSKGLGEADPPLRWKVVSGSLVGDERPTGALARESGEGEGRYPIGQGSLSLSGNYALTFVPGHLTITELTPVLDGGRVIAGDIRYGDALAMASLQGSVRHPSTGEVLPGVFAWDVPDTHPEAGLSRHRWRFTPAANGGARLAPLQGDCEVSVLPAVLDVRVNALDLCRPFFMVNPQFKLEYSGFMNGDDASDLLLAPEAVTDARLTSPVGRYAVHLQGGLARNYRFRYHDCELEVVKAVPQQLESVCVRGMSYGLPFETSMLSGSFVPPEPIGMVAGHLELLELEPGMHLPAGTYEMGWRFVPVNENFEEVHGMVAFEVKKAPLTVHAHDVTLKIDDAVPASYEYSLSGFVRGDDASSAGIGPETIQAYCEIASTAFHAIYPIRFRFGSLENYELIPVEGELTVACLTPVPQGLEKVWVYLGEELSSMPTCNGHLWTCGVFLKRAPSKRFLHHEIIVREDRESVIQGVSSEHGTAYFEGKHEPGESGERIPGVLHWESDVPLTNVGPHPNVPWRFVPSEEYANRYEEATGLSTVVVKKKVVEIFPPKVEYVNGNQPTAELFDNWNWSSDSLEPMPGFPIEGPIFLTKFAGFRDHEQAQIKGVIRDSSEMKWNAEALSHQHVYRYVYAQDVFDVSARPRVQEIQLEDRLEDPDHYREALTFKTHLVNAEDHSPVPYDVHLTTQTHDMYDWRKCDYVLPKPEYDGLDLLVKYIFPERSYPHHFYQSELPVVDVLCRVMVYNGTVPKPEFAVKFSDVLTKADVLGEPAYVDVRPVPGVYRISRGTLRMADQFQRAEFCEGKLIIRKRPLTIRTGPVVKMVGEKDVAPSFEIVSGSLLPGDELRGELSRKPGESVETYAYTLGTLNHPYYDITLTEDSYLTIVPSGGPDIEVRGVCRGTLRAGEPVAAVEFEDVIRRISTGEEVPGRLSFMRRNLRLPVGQYWEWGVFYPDDPSQCMEFPFRTLITVMPPKLKVRADSQRMAWGDAMPALTYALSEPSLASGLRGRLEAVSRDDGHYDIALGSLSAGSGCELELEPGAVVNVHARHVVLEVVNGRKVAGNPDPQFSYRIASGSLAPGDSFTNLSFKREPGESLGQYAVTLSLSGTALDPDLTHYDVELIPGVLDVVGEETAPVSAQKTKVVVNASWGRGIASGETVSWGGGSYIYGVNGFSDLETALETVRQDGVILLTPGVYESASGEWLIDRGISLIGDDEGQVDAEILLVGSLRTDSRVSKLLLSNLSIVASDDRVPAVSIGDDVGSVVIVNCRLIGGETAMSTGAYGNGVSVIYSELLATDCCLRSSLSPGQSPPVAPLTLVCNMFEGEKVLEVPGFSVIASSNLHNGTTMDDLE